LVEAIAVQNQKVTELHTLLEILPVGVWIGDRECQRIAGNRAAYEMFGLPKGINLSLSVPPEEAMKGVKCLVDGEEVTAPENLPMQRVARTGVPLEKIEHALVFPDGTTKTVYASVAPIYDEQGQVRLVIGAYADITERKGLELALQDKMEELQTTHEELDRQNRELLASRRDLELEREHFAELFNNAPDGYVVTDLSGVVQAANAAACDLTHQSREFLVGLPLVNCLARQHRQHFRTVLGKFRFGAAQAAEQFEASLQAKPALPIACWVTASGVVDSEGKLAGIRWLLRDITARKHSEELLRESEQR